MNEVMIHENYHHSEKFLSFNERQKRRSRPDPLTLTSATPRL